MDDLEFRRRIMSNPKARNEELIATIANSDMNAKYAEEILNLDARIEQAMRVEVPENLADKILFQHSSKDKVLRPNFAKRSFALAASIAFIAGILIGQMNWSSTIIPAAHASLADTALEHVISERPFTDTLDEQVSSRQINAKLSPFAYRFTEHFPYHVYYLNHCGFGDSNALHMVFQGEKGRITLFITDIPSESIANFGENNLTGVLMPIGRASMILVGELGEDVNSVAQQLKSIVNPMS